MKRTISYVYLGSVVVLLIAAAIVFSWKEASTATEPGSTGTPSAPLTSFSASPSSSSIPSPAITPLANWYSSSAYGLSFEYPEGYFAVEQPIGKQVFVQNQELSASEMDDTALRQINFRSGESASNTTEFEIKMMAGVSESTVTSRYGTQIRVYTFPNPTDSSITLKAAFWEGKYNHSLLVPWDRTGTTTDQSVQQLEEVALFEKVLPTISMAE